MDCYCDYDPPEFFSSDVRRARKSYRCEECSCNILPGEKYEYAIGKWEGYLSEHRTCSRCVDFRTWVINNLPCFCWLYGELFSGAREAAAEAHYRAGDEVKGLRFGVLRRIRKIELASIASRHVDAA